MSDCALRVVSADTGLPSDALAPIVSLDGGSFKIPGRGGARVLILVTWDLDATGEDSLLILYGVSDGERVPLAIAQSNEAPASYGPMPVFAVGGFPFEHYEVDGFTSSTGVGTCKVRITALVSAGAGSSMEVLVNGQFSVDKVDLTGASPPTAYTIARATMQWVPGIMSIGRGGKRWESVTPDNANDLVRWPTDGMYVGTAGNIKIDDEAGNTVVIPNVAAGMVHPIRAKRVHSTSTTASDIFAVYGT